MGALLHILSTQTLLAGVLITDLGSKSLDVSLHEPRSEAVNFDLKLLRSIV
jgi:hypothetical protein